MVKKIIQPYRKYVTFFNLVRGGIMVEKNTHTKKSPVGGDIIEKQYLR
jgi:hypothetical protein